MDFFSSFESRRKLAELNCDVSRQVLTVDALQRQLQETEHRLGKTMLAVEALVEILSEQQGISLHEVMERITEIDLRDGKLDGKLSRLVIECPNCHRPVGSNSARCVYCGEERPPISRVTE